MEKSAQKRSVLQKLHEWGNVSGRAAERFFSPELKRVMDSLRENDDQIRANVVGEVIGKATPIPGAKPLKELLKQAKANINRREYMSAVVYLSKFHQQMDTVDKSIMAFNISVDKVHDEFLFNGLQEEQRKYLLEMQDRFTPKKATYYNNNLSKEAGVVGSIADFLANVGTRRGRALAMWEKRYPKAAEQLKKDTRTLLDKSESLLSTTLSSLKDMGKARASRAVDDYVDAAKKIKKEYDTYDKLFKEVYVRSYQKFIKQIEDNKIVPAVPVSDSEKDKQQEVIPSSPTVPDLNLPSKLIAPTLPVSKSPSEQTLDRLDQLQKTELQPQQLQFPFTPAKEQPIRPPITPTPLQVPAEPLQAQTHRKFYEVLNSMSGENPLVLASFIKKYANTIKNSDPETAVQLLNIVKSIKG